MSRQSSTGFKGRAFLKTLWIAAFGALVVCTMLSATASAVERCHGNTNPVLVQNGGFETGDLTGWTVAWPNPPDPFMFVAGSPRSGNFSMWMGSIPGANRISQTISGTTTGSVYTVCFWLSKDTACCGNSFEAQWHGYDLLTLTNSTGLGYTYFSFNVYALGGGQDTLVFQAQEVPAFWHLDDVSVQLCTGCQAPNQPDPATAARSKQTH